MLRAILFSALVATASAAHAGDKPIYAPAPDWVKPVTVPPTPTKPDEAAVRILLSDQQIAFERGRQSVYLQFAALIQTPQGLDAGNISFPWKPDTSDLIVHKVLIRRGDKVLDVLKGGQTFTVVRRETNLESATLDGVLTANIQPEGLQVGDVLEVAVTITSSDPVMKGHVEAVAAHWDGAPASRVNMRMQWPSTLPMRFRQSGQLPVLKPVKTGGTMAVELVLDSVEPIPGPKGAPVRFQLGRRVEATAFASWAEIGTLLAPLYQTAAVLPVEGPLADEVARIKASSTDPRTRTEAALALVQDRVRYVALAMGNGGLVPTDAATTWARRYGDCKGKTALLLAVLGSLGIQAEAVAVNSQFGDGLDERLPMVGAFDHVLVRATVSGRSYWLDGTRKGDTSLDRLAVPAFEWGLPLRADGASLVRMVRPPLDQPTQSVSIHFDARAGLTLPADAKVETVLRGDAAIAINMALANQTGDARDRAIRAYWKNEYDFIEPTAVSATFDAKTGEQRLTLEGKAKMDWSSGWYETDGTRVGYRADFTREAGPNRDAPFAVFHPYFVRTEQTILLPPGFPAAKSDGKGDIDRTVAGVEYRRKVTIKDRVFRVEKTERSIADEFAAKDAPAAQVALREMAADALYIRRPDEYRSTAAELSAAEKETPTTADAFVTRGNIMLTAGRIETAIADFDKALALDPKNVTALANRGLAHVWQGKHDLGTRDIDAALVIDAQHPVAFRARGLMAQQKGDHRAAVEALGVSLRLDPASIWALVRRAVSNRALGNDDAALADATAALEKNPAESDLYLLRANIYRSRGQIDRMLAEATAMVAANPDSTWAHVASANLFGSAGRDAEARRAFDRAIAIKPEAFIYLNRARYRMPDDRNGKIADIDAALKLEPTSTEALLAKAEWLSEGGDLTGAIAIYTTALAVTPDNFDMLTRRGILRAKAGERVASDRDFVAARALAKDPGHFNSMCWAKATAGVALQSALADCEEAVAKAPDDVAFLDSKAFVLLRLGRIDESIAIYDRALSKNATLAGSLYGRAVAWAIKGNQAQSDADLAVAVKQAPAVEARFAGYGVTMPKR